MRFTSIATPFALSSGAFVTIVTGATLPKPDGPVLSLALGGQAWPANVVPMPAAVVSQMLDAQNAERTALKLPLAQWNDQLEQRAQRWASNCQFQHTVPQDPGTALGTRPARGMGENMAYETGGVGHPDQWIASFRAEKGTGSEGHYQALVVSTWTQVGCAGAICSNADGSKYVIGVCNYAKPGVV